MNDLRGYPRPFICLVRHGETQLSPARCYNGVTDVELDEVGVRQAQAIAPRLAVVDSLLSIGERRWRND